MKENPILCEIRETRDEIARETGYDLKRMFEFVRECEQVARKRGVCFSVPETNAGCLPSSVVREDPQDQ